MVARRRIIAQSGTLFQPHSWADPIPRQASALWRGARGTGRGGLCEACAGTFGDRFSASTGRLAVYRQAPPVGELQQVVGGAHEAPFAAHVFDAAQQNLAEAAGLLSLAEHWLGQLLSQALGAFVAACLDFFAHGFDPRFGQGRLRPGRGCLR